MVRHFKGLMCLSIWQSNKADISVQMPKKWLHFINQNYDVPTLHLSDIIKIIWRIDTLKHPQECEEALFNLKRYSTIVRAKTFSYLLVSSISCSLVLNTSSIPGLYFSFLTNSIQALSMTKFPPPPSNGTSFSEAWSTPPLWLKALAWDLQLLPTNESCLPREKGYPVKALFAPGPCMQQ